MSRSSSRASSRQPSPSAITRLLQIRLRRQIAWFSTRPVAIGFGIATFISFILAITSIKPHEFCSETQTNDWCIPCPEHAKCRGHVFACKNGTIKNKQSCLPVENFDESDLLNLHELIVEEIAKGTIKDKRTLLEFAIGSGEAESAVDAVSALLYDDKYYIGEISGAKDVVLVKPQAFSPPFIWSVFLLCFICFLASLEAIMFKKKTKSV